MIGVRASGRRGPDDPDLVQNLAPVADRKAVASEVLDITHKLVEPGIEGIQIKTVPDAFGSMASLQKLEDARFLIGCCVQDVCRTRAVRSRTSLGRLRGALTVIFSVDFRLRALRSPAHPSHIGQAAELRDSR